MLKMKTVLKDTGNFPEPKDTVAWSWELKNHPEPQQLFSVSLGSVEPAVTDSLSSSPFPASLHPRPSGLVFLLLPAHSSRWLPHGLHVDSILVRVRLGCAVATGEPPYLYGLVQQRFVSSSHYLSSVDKHHHLMMPPS